MHDRSALPRTVLRRHPERAVTDRAALHAILDESLVVHLGCATPRGPLVLPMAFGRRGERLFFHGAVGNAILEAALASGAVCVTATLVDGLVLSRTAFHHSMNYRSAVVFGPLHEVVAPEEKRAAMHAVLEHATPGRAAESRPPSDAELRAVRVVALDLDEASVKMRRGPPLDAGADLEEPHWAGVIPLRVAPAAPVAASARPLPASAARAALARLPILGERRRHAGFELDGDPKRLELATLLGWLRGSYWGQDLDEGRLARSLLGSVVVGAYDDGGRQVGFARAVTDLETFAWLADVFVAPEARGVGVGKAMVGWLLALPELARVRKWLLATRDAHEVYRPLGFADASPGRFMVREASRPPQPGGRQV